MISRCLRHPLPIDCYIVGVQYSTHAFAVLHAGGTCLNRFWFLYLMFLFLIFKTYRQEDGKSLCILYELAVLRTNAVDGTFPGGCCRQLFTMWMQMRQLTPSLFIALIFQQFLAPGKLQSTHRCENCCAVIACAERIDLTADCSIRRQSAASLRRPRTNLSSSD